MKVWLVNPFDNLPPEGFRPQRYWLMGQAFAAAGHDVLYWTSDFNHGTKARRVLAGGGAAAPFRLRLVPTLPYVRNVSLRRLRSHARLADDWLALARAEPERPDLIVASLPPVGLADRALSFASEVGARFAVDIQDAWPETFGRLLPRGFKWTGRLLFAPLRRRARRLYREADFVTGVSARYRGLSGRADFHLAYLGIDADAPAVTDRRGPPTRLLYLGALGQGYDLGTVLEAMRREPALTLDIAGGGPREAELRAHVRAAGLETRVRFHGYLGAADLKRLLEPGGVGVIPMRDDSWVGLPNKLGDYLAASLSVVSSLHGECGELLERTGFGATYAWGDAGSLLAALARLGKKTGLPDELRAGRIYPDYVAFVTSSARTCP